MASRASVCFKPFGLLLLLLLCVPAFAQSANLRGIGVSPRARITQAIDPSHTVPLKGNVHPLARAQYDRGAAPDSLPADRMLLVLQRSPEQQAALDQLMQEQQTKSSPNYHRWLTPQEFGQTFGPAESDVNVITNWLTSQGFQVNNVAAARNVIEFSGTAAQVRQAFGTQIHEYDVNGRQHFANATDPQIPEALAPVVAGVASLNSFRKKPMSHRVAETAITTKPGAAPQYNWSSSLRGVAPSDFATIYNVKPLWDAGTDGTGQTIAVVGRTNINLSEVTFFRNIFGLPPNDPEVVLNGPDPGVISGEDLEAYLDVEWSGAVAKMAKIKFVVSAGTATTDGVDLSAMYIVDKNLAPVMSVSFGQCEASLGTAENQFFSTLWQQAAAQGITVFVSAGDNGSAGCDDPSLKSGTNFVAASKGLAVSGLASTPYNVAVGGTDFDQPTLSTYWDASGNAIGYIAEKTWNDSCAQAEFSGGCTSATIGSKGIWAGSGGFSNVYTKPSWQRSTVPLANHRYLPDVSLMSGDGANNSFYIVCAGNCTTNSKINGVGGTSAAAPSFAGIMALVNQKTGAPQGNANFVFYSLAAGANASCNSSEPAKVGAGNSCTFYDITKGNISVPCTTGTGCSGGVMVDPNVTSTRAWTTTMAYDLASGLGSVNAKNLVNSWSTATFTPTTTTITSSILTGLTHGATTNVTVSVNPTSGSGTPTGDVALIANYADGTSIAIDNATLSGKLATLSNEVLPGGTYNLVAHYAGDGTFGASDSAGTPVTINPQSSQTVVKLVAFSGNTASFATTVPYGSPYILRMWVTGPGETISSPIQDSACASSNPATCPTGHITLKDGAALLDGGDFTLSGFGWVEDPIIQLKGGSHTITATYLGDNSYLASAQASTTINISQATTSIAAPTNPGSVKTNTNVNISATVSAPTSNGAAPGGTVTFYDGSTAMTGTITYAGSDFNLTNNTPPTTTATITTQFTTTGTHQITAQYNGDVNYSASAKSSATAITVTQGAGPATHLSVTAPANASTGTAFNFTVTALDANNVTATGYTGTVHFTSTDAAATLPTNATLTNGTGSFSAILNTIGTFTLTASDTVTSSIAGTSGNISVGAPIADFTMSAAPASGTVVKGSSGTSTITVASTNGFASTVALTCTVAPIVTKGPTCSVSPSSVNPTSATPATPTLTVATTADTIASLHKGLGWTLAGGSGVFAFVILGIPGVRRRTNGAVLMLLLGLMLVGGTVACGGGGSSSGGGGGHTTIPGTPSGTYTVTVTGTSGTLTHTTTYTVTVGNTNGGGSQQTAQGVYQGTASTGSSFETIVLPNDKAYAIYGTSTGNVFYISGMMAGQGSSNNGTYTANLTDYYWTGSTYSATLTSSYVAGSTLNGTISESGSTFTFTGTAIPSSLFNYNTPAALSSIAGSWTGSDFSGYSTTVSVSSSGTITGTSSGCSFTGSVTSDSAKNFYNVSLSFGGSPCLAPNQTVSGVAVSYLMSDGITRQLVVAGTTSGGLGSVFVATR